MNLHIVEGHAGKDPEVRTLESGVKVATFSLATSESYKNKEGEKVTDTQWHNIVVWRGLAEVVEKYVKKGSHLLISGKSVSRSYDDKEGMKRYTTELVCRDLKMLGSKGSGSSSEASKPNQEDIPKEPETGDDLPFS